MNLSIKSTFATIANDLVYASAPVILDANIVLPEFQLSAEKIHTTSNVVVWTIVDELGSNYINSSNIIDIIGEIVSLNVATRSQVGSNLHEPLPINYTRLPFESLENARIFSTAFVNAAQTKSENAAQSAEDNFQSDLMTTFINIGEFTIYANWLPLMKTLQSFNDNNLFNSIDLFKILPPNTNFVPFPQCMHGLSLILQPWILQYITNLLNGVFPVNLNLALSETNNKKTTTDDETKRVFKSIYDLLCHFNSSGQRSEENKFKLAVRHIIAPFLDVKLLKHKWVVDFFESILTKELSQVTAEFSKIMPRFCEIDIDPTFISDMIVFLFGHVSNSTNEQTLTNICEAGRRKRILRFNTIDNQMINNKAPMFHISKIRTIAIDPIFLIVHKLLTRSCQSNVKSLTQVEKNRLSNLLYTNDEKIYIRNLVMERHKASIKDNNRSFIDPFSASAMSTNSASCAPTIHKLKIKQYEYVKKMKFNKLVKYPSELTFSTDNYAEASLKFMHNLDAYGGLFIELVNREIYDFNNIVCNVRPIFH